MDSHLSLAKSEPIRPDNFISPARRLFIMEKPSLLQQIFQCLIVAGLALVSYFLIGHYVIQSVRVEGQSMTPTLRDSDRYLLNHLAYLVRSPQPEDIVVLKDPAGGFAIKRIIAGPGDSVYLKNGQVFINGRKMLEPYLAPGTPTFADWKRRGEAMIQCGKNQFFVMGDNRQCSADSRNYGPVPRESILGPIIPY